MTKLLFFSNKIFEITTKNYGKGTGQARTHYAQYLTQPIYHLYILNFNKTNLNAVYFNEPKLIFSVYSMMNRFLVAKFLNVAGLTCKYPKTIG